MHRLQRRFNQEQVARLLELGSVKSLSQWETGVKLPGAVFLLKLSILYRTLPTELYFEYFQELHAELTEKEWELFGEQ